MGAGASGPGDLNGIQAPRYQLGAAQQGGWTARMADYFSSRMAYGILNVPKNAREAPSLADLSPYDPTQGKRFGRGFSAVRVGLASHGWQG
jgi:hypothetical protein